MQLDLRRTAAFVAGLAMVAGIAYFLVSDSGAEQPPPPSQGNGSAESPRPTETPSPTTEPPPELNNTGNDFEAIWRSIEDYRVWLGRNPQPHLLKRIYHPDCPCYPKGIGVLQRLASRGLHYDDEGTRVVSVELADRPARHIALLRVVDQHGPQIIVNEAGTVVRRGDGWAPTRWIFTLNKDENGYWRLRHVLKEGS
jgi:hypothetical protein